MITRDYSRATKYTWKCGCITWRFHCRNCPYPNATWAFPELPIVRAGPVECLMDDSQVCADCAWRLLRWNPDLAKEYRFTG